MHILTKISLSPFDHIIFFSVIHGKNAILVEQLVLKISVYKTTEILQIGKLHLKLTIHAIEIDLVTGFGNTKIINTFVIIITVELSTRTDMQIFTLNKV